MTKSKISDAEKLLNLPKEPLVIKSPTPHIIEYYKQQARRRPDVMFGYTVRYEGCTGIASFTEYHDAASFAATRLDSYVSSIVIENEELAQRKWDESHRKTSTHRSKVSRK
jgi:hypothetical protein